MIEPGTRVGKVIVGEVLPITEGGKRMRACVCDCGRHFLRRQCDLVRALAYEQAVSCFKGQCRVESASRAGSYTRLAGHAREHKQRQTVQYVRSQGPREKVWTCKVCYNQPWKRLRSVEADDGDPVVGADLKCRGCQGTYAEEPAKDVPSYLGSSAGALEDAG